MEKEVLGSGLTALKEEARQGTSGAVGPSNSRGILALHTAAKASADRRLWVDLIETIYATRRGYRPADWRNMLTESAGQIVSLTEAGAQ